MRMTFSHIDHCRLCFGRDLVTGLDLGEQVLAGTFPKDQLDDIPAVPLALCRCQDCGAVQLTTTVDKELLFRDGYGYRTGLNGSMVKHVEDIVHEAEEIAGLQQGDLVLDIGANDGTLLGAYRTKGIARLGIDPCSIHFSDHWPLDVTFVSKFFSAAVFNEASPNAKAKIVTSLAMFYDLDDPIHFAKEVASCMTDDGIWITEQSYFPALVSANSFDTVCHEHLEYYTVKDLNRIAHAAELKIVGLAFNGTNGGSVCVTFAKGSHPHIEESREIVHSAIAIENATGFATNHALELLAARIEFQCGNLFDLLKSMKQNGKKVLGYGASTKGNVLLQHAEIGIDLIPAIAEVNERKFGCFTPGTLIPIISEAEARAMKPDYFLVLPWHFKNAIIDREREFLKAGGALIFPLPGVQIYRDGDPR